MPQSIVQIPLGANGAISLTESAGKINLSITEALDIGALIKNLADNTTNATLKVILTEAAAAIEALPA